MGLINRLHQSKLFYLVSVLLLVILVVGLFPRVNIMITGFSTMDPKDYCGYDIKDDFTFFGNLNCSEHIGPAMTVGVDNIVVDCNNWEITGTGSLENDVGFYIENKNNVTIKNCNINYFRRGVRTKNSTVNVINNNFFNTLMSGIYIEGEYDGKESGSDTRNTIQGNNFINSSRMGEKEFIPPDGHLTQEGAITIFNEYNTLVHDNYIENSGYRGISIYESEFNNITENYIVDSYTVAIWLRSNPSTNLGGKNIVTGNEILGGCVGIEVSSPGNLIGNNNITGDLTCSGRDSLETGCKHPDFTKEETYGIWSWICLTNESNHFVNNHVSGYRYGSWFGEDNFVVEGGEYNANSDGIYINNIGLEPTNIPLIKEVVFLENCHALNLYNSSADLEDSYIYENNPNPLISCVREHSTYDFTFSSTEDFDEQYKEEGPDGNYRIETNLDNLRIPEGVVALGNKYSDRFTYDDVDGDTWKWNPYWDNLGGNGTASSSVSGGELNLDINPGNSGIGYWHILSSQLIGDFDVQVDFSDYNYGNTTDVYMGLVLTDTYPGEYALHPFTIGMLRTTETTAQNNHYSAYDSEENFWTQVPSNDTYGKFRITRETVGDESTFTWSYWNNTRETWEQLESTVYNLSKTPTLHNPLYILLDLENYGSEEDVSVKFDDFVITSGVLYPLKEAYRTSWGSWGSLVTLSAGKSLESLILNYESVNDYNYIYDVYIMDPTGTNIYALRNFYNTGLTTSGNSVKITEKDLTSGSFYDIPSSGEDSLFGVVVDLFKYNKDPPIPVDDIQVYLTSVRGNFYTRGPGIFLSESALNIKNTDFMNTGEYGIISDSSKEVVQWTVTEDVICSNNNIDIRGWLISNPGKSVSSSNCVISIDNELFDIAAGQTTYFKEEINVPPGSRTSINKNSFALNISSDTGYSGDLKVKLYNKLPTTARGYNGRALGTWGEFTVEGASGNMSQAILKMYYTDEQLVDKDLNESTLILQYCDYTTGSCVWEQFFPPKGGIGEDSYGKYVWANTTHFSGFGIFGLMTNGEILTWENVYEDELLVEPTPTDEDAAKNRTGTLSRYTYLIYYWVEDVFEQDLKATDKVKFNFSDEGYTITILTIQPEYTRLWLEKDSTEDRSTVQIEEGNERLFDLDNDGVYDIKIHLERVDDYTGYFVFEKIIDEIELVPEPLPPRAQITLAEEGYVSITEEGKEDVLVLIIVMSLAYILVMYWCFYKKRK